MPKEITTSEEKQTAILTWLAVDFGDNLEFLQKINRLTFGLLKQNNLFIRDNNNNNNHEGNILPQARL